MRLISCLHLRLFSLIFIVCSPIVISGIVYASSSDWVTVETWNGEPFYTSEEFERRFECNHYEWRLIWSYLAVGEVPFESILVIQKDDKLLVYSSGYFDKQNDRTFHVEEDFNLTITCAFMEYYLIILQQDVKSIPEFPSWIILPLLLVVTLFGIIIRKKFRVL